MSNVLERWQKYSPVLTGFCQTIASMGIVPHHVQPDIIAAHFRSFLESSHPFDMREANGMIQVLELNKIVLFMPDLTKLTGKSRARGMWRIDDNGLVIYIQPVKKRPDGYLTRPRSSMIHTLLHEIAEIILAISYSIHNCTNELPHRRRERWADRFAGMCMMPRKRFANDISHFGLNLAELADEYKVSLAATARQIRDVATSTNFYYFCRCDFVEDPEEEFADFPDEVTSEMITTLNKTNGGYVVRVRDVVRRQFDHHRKRRGQLPMYNLPGSRVYRIMHPIMRDCVESGRRLLIGKIAGGSTLENSYSDLFGMQNMSVLVIPYGHTKTKGFYLQAVDADAAHYLRNQAEQHGIESIQEIPWLFTTNEYKTSLTKKRKVFQKTLDLAMSMELRDLAYPWLRFEGVNWSSSKNPASKKPVRAQLNHSQPSDSATVS